MRPGDGTRATLHDQDANLQLQLRPLNSQEPVISNPQRRRPEPSQGSPVRAMSLVGLKNLFFRQTLAPIPSRRSRRSGAATLDWSDVSEQPLLESSDSSSPVPRPSLRGSSDNGRDDGTDLESQPSVYSKTEKAESKKGFRVDARIISDATIGLSDGLTVPFALTAGLSALGNTKVVIYGGFAELVAGAISMGLGGYLGAKSEA